MIIAARFNGPPGTGNGGYTAGLVADRFADLVTDPPADARPAPTSSAVEITLRRPPPLETELTVRDEPAPPDAGGERAVPALSVYDRSELIAQAVPSTVEEDEAVPAVSFAAALDASASYQGFTNHPFPTCFVCGPLRSPGDGLRLFPGRLADGRTATPFVVPVEVSSALIWAALDCPGGWAVPQEQRPYVLGRLTARLDGLPRAGEECVVMGERVSEQGRRAFVRTTLYSADGQVLARARATWFAR